MKNFKILLVIIVILTSALNYSCEHLCGDDDSNATHREAFIQKKDTLNVSKID